MKQREINIFVKDEADLGYSAALTAAKARAEKRLKAPVALVCETRHTNTFPQTPEENAGEITFTFKPLVAP